MYVLEIMQDGVSHGYEYHDGEIRVYEDQRIVVLVRMDDDTDIGFDLDTEIAFIDHTNLSYPEWRGNYLGVAPIDPRTEQFVNRIYTNPRWGR